MNAGVVIFAGIRKSSYSICTTKLVSTKFYLERYATIPNTADIEIEGQRQKD
jgi:hypothetical protein